MKKIKNIIVTLLASCMIFAITPVQINASDALEEKVTINYEDTTIQETVIGNERLFWSKETTYYDPVF